MEHHAEQIRRVALVVASLDTRSADKLLEQFDSAQAAIVRDAVAQLGDVDPRAEREALDAFFRAAAPRPGSNAAPAKAPAKTSSLAGAPLRFLHEAAVDKLLPLISNEHPQTIAVVVSHLSPARASELLARLPGEVQLDVIRRLAELETADESILREIEEVLQLRIVERIENEHRQQAGVQFLSNVLSTADANVKRSILANVAEHDRQLAGRLADHRWTFDDVTRLPTRELTLVLETAGPELVTLAVAGAPTTIAERCLDALPLDRQRQLRHAITTLGPTRLTDLEKAQRELANIAGDLATSGRIDVPKSKGRSLSLAG